MRRLYRKQIVEESLELCPSSLIRRGAVRGEIGGCIEYAIYTDLERMVVRYAADGFVQCYELALATTPCHYGGVRWWVVCCFCERRRRTVYLPDGRAIFGCRRCCGLAYRTQRMRPVQRSALVLEKLSARYPGRRPRGMWRMSHARGRIKCLEAEIKLRWLLGRARLASV